MHKRFLVYVFVCLLTIGCSDDTEQTPTDDAGQTADVGPSDADNDGSNGMTDGGVQDAGEDTGLTDAGEDASEDMAADTSSGDMTTMDADLGTGDVGGDAATDMATITCTPGASGGTNDFCENSYDCDGTTYKIECDTTTNMCTCYEDGVETKTMSGDSCGEDDLRDCGAPIPIDPGCGSVGRGGGNDFCETLVTCDGVTYIFQCDNNSNCTCTVDGEDGPDPNATDCVGTAGLEDCGAPLNEN